MEPYSVHAEADVGAAAEVGKSINREREGQGKFQNHPLLPARIAYTFSPIGWVESLRSTGRAIFGDKKTDFGNHQVQLWRSHRLQEKFPGLGLA